ncbi:uncharacterized protein LOC122568409 [Bombus pyrosoma]|uniref:uncharacterized protein LOC122568409 n=1 Tax=Bombus pyrosoma TaxID=396416 RepID=UPI001CB890E2|nr:uncharacterized protein LOC122568409 [Bombus pyrosoma]
MYWAPVWADDLMARRRTTLLLRRLHRVIAVRVVRGYRAVSHASANVLAASPPWELRVLVLKKRYEQRRPWVPEVAEQAAPDDLGTAEEDAWDQWRSQLFNAAGELRAAAAVLPNWGTWRSRRGLPLTFIMTQILTGHGVFDEYQKKIGRETADICHHCGQDKDHHGAAYAGGLPGIGSAPLYPAASHRREAGALSDHSSDAERATGI